MTEKKNITAVLYRLLQFFCMIIIIAYDVFKNMGFEKLFESAKQCCLLSEINWMLEPRKRRIFLK